MIIPNLMVTNMRRSLAFYRDILGMSVSMMVSAEREILPDDNGDNIVFATLEWDGAQLMLQTVASLAAELPPFATVQQPAFTGTIYFRDFHPDRVRERVTEDLIVKGPLLQWYGMKELYLRDPDGHIVCLGAPEGAPSA